MQQPFHPGELLAHRRVGVEADVVRWAPRMIRDFMPEQHRSFYAGLPFVVLSARDAKQRPWATLLAGGPGFMQSPDARTLHIAARPGQHDPLAASLAAGSDVGMLGIELATRRRNRINGRVLASDGVGLRVAAVQTFGNCPQYIVPRSWQSVAVDAAAVIVRRGDRLSAAWRKWIGAADTFFIASGHRGRGEHVGFGMDASHRGGPPGFVAVESERSIVFPDYAGNNLFNTIGNLLADPRVGLLFVDFASGSLLQLTGRASIDWDSPAVAEHPGAQRLVRIEIEAVVEQHGVLPLRWQTQGGSVRRLRVADKVRESDLITSFWLQAAGGETLADFEPGQHLPIEVVLPGDDTPTRRSYSLSIGPGSAGPDSNGAGSNGAGSNGAGSNGLDSAGPGSNGAGSNGSGSNRSGSNGYRISVKREAHGRVSRYLHDALEVGDTIHAGMPSGDFVLQPGSRPVALLSAGVGVTPMLSMLHALSQRDETRPVWFIHGARDGRHHGFREEVERVQAQRKGIAAHYVYSRPLPEDELGRDYHQAGRIDGDTLGALLPDLDADFYLCGPVAFVADLSAALEARGVDANRIHIETFGPQAARRRAP